MSMSCLGRVLKVAQHVHLKAESLQSQAEQTLDDLANFLTQAIDPLGRFDKQEVARLEIALKLEPIDVLLLHLGITEAWGA